MTSEEQGVKSTEPHTKMNPQTMAPESDFDIQAVYRQKQAEVLKIKSLIDQKDQLERSADALQVQHNYLEKLSGTLALTHRERNALQETNEALRKDWTVSTLEFDQKSQERENIERDFSKTAGIVSCFSIYNLPLTPVTNMTPAELMKYVKSKNEILVEQLRNNEKLAKVIEGMQEIEAKAQEIEALKQSVTTQSAMSTVMELELQGEKAAYEDAIAQLRKNLDGTDKEQLSIVQMTSHSTQTEDTSVKEMDEAVAKAVAEKVDEAVFEAVIKAVFVERRKMMPLVEVGIDIRNRNEEWKKKSFQSSTTLYKGDRASHYGRALADAVKILYHTTFMFASEQDLASRNYTERYGFSPDFIEANYDNKMFLTVVDWRIGMKAFKGANYSSTDFSKKYDQVFRTVEFFSPTQIKNYIDTLEFKDLYRMMTRWHEDARMTYKSNRGWDR